MQHKINAKFIYFLIIVVIFCAVSLLLRNFLEINFNGADLKLFSIDFMRNYGAAFSILSTHTHLLIAISVTVLLSVLLYIYRNLSEFSHSDLFFSALLSAGIICNLTERLLDGYVTDYISLNFVIFPIFNISDIYITVGSFFLICNILFSNGKSN